KRLAEDNREPVRLEGAALKAALDREGWRTIDQVGELTAIEFRKLALDRVKGFTRAEKIADENAGKLLKVAEAQWERLAQEAGRKEPKRPPHKIDWKRRCREFAAAFTEEAGGLLTDDQRPRFRQLVESCFSVLPEPVK